MKYLGRGNYFIWATSRGIGGRIGSRHFHLKRTADELFSERNGLTKVRRRFGFSFVAGVVTLAVNRHKEGV